MLGRQKVNEINRSMTDVVDKMHRRRHLLNYLIYSIICYKCSCCSPTALGNKLYFVTAKTCELTFSSESVDGREADP